MSSPPDAPRPTSSHRQRLAILAALWLAVLSVLVAFRHEVMPFAGAALIAYIVAPLVEHITHLPLGKRRIPHWLAILIIYALFFALAYLFLTALVPQLYREFLRLSHIITETANSLTPERIQGLARKSEQWLTEHGLPVALSDRALDGGNPDAVPPGHWSVSFDLEQAFRTVAQKTSLMAREGFANIVVISRKVITAVLRTVFALFFILMVAAFFSVDSKKIGRYAQSMIPPDLNADAQLLLARVDRSLGGVVRGQLTICLVNGCLTFVGLLVFGVKFAFILATVATLFSLVPIFGTILSSVPIIGLALAQSWKAGVGMTVWILGIHALEAYFLNPKILGRAARIHPVVVAFSLVAGERSFGILGALFAVPIAAILVACFDFLREKAQRPTSAP